MGFMKPIVENSLPVIPLLQGPKMVQNTNCQMRTCKKSHLTSENIKIFSHPFNISSKTLKYEKLKFFMMKTCADPYLGTEYSL